MSSPSIGLVIGVVVGIVAAVAIVVFFNSWLTRRRDNLELQASMMSGIPTPVVRKMGYVPHGPDAEWGLNGYQYSQGGPGSVNGYAPTSYGSAYGNNFGGMPMPPSIPSRPPPAFYPYQPYQPGPY